MNKKTYNPENGPKAVGPYSLAASAGELLFVSGQIPLDPESGELVKGSVSSQARRCLENLKIVLEGSGSCLDNVVRVGIFITDMGKFGELNEVYSEFFRTDYPARAVVQVSGLPKGVDVEMEAVAIIKR